LLDLLSDLAEAKAISLEGSSTQEAEVTEFSAEYRGAPHYTADMTVDGERYLYFTPVLIKFTDRGAEAQRAYEESGGYESQKAFVPYTLLSFAYDAGNVSNITGNGRDTLVLTFAGKGAALSFSRTEQTSGGYLVISYGGGRVLRSALSFGGYTNSVSYGYDETEQVSLPTVLPPQPAESALEYYKYLMIKNRENHATLRRTVGGTEENTGVTLRTFATNDAQLQKVTAIEVAGGPQYTLTLTYKSPGVQILGIVYPPSFVQAVISLNVNTLAIQHLRFGVEPNATSYFLSDS
jgi:hypothetical protein